ncbi:MAG: hypothetical protein VB031_07645 [Eubacteriaceae bacterium]|nr:hypothetical protein [Eubacteriaceae bacterium]
MMKTYTKGNFTFRDFGQNEIESLLAIQPQEMFVSEETTNEVTALLDLKNLSDEELQATRNGIVRLYSDDESIPNDNMTRMSMVTAIIDNIRWRKGYEV